MKKTLYIIIPLFVLALMEGVAWMVLRFPKEVSPVPPQADERVKIELQTKTEPQQAKPIEKIVPPPLPPAPYSSMGGADSENFPPPSTEVKKGRTERTIHMGVRQYVWEPATITAKRGELVRLIIHNADVKHGLVIPDLGVNQDIPEDGAVVEFMASKSGTFEFFCSVWCGVGHIEMRGKIVIQ